MRYSPILIECSKGVVWNISFDLFDLKKINKFVMKNENQKFCQVKVRLLHTLGNTPFCMSIQHSTPPAGPCTATTSSMSTIKGLSFKICDCSFLTPPTDTSKAVLAHETCNETYYKSNYIYCETNNFQPNHYWEHWPRRIMVCNFDLGKCVHLQDCSLNGFKYTVVYEGPVLLFVRNHRDLGRSRRLGTRGHYQWCRKRCKEICCRSPSAVLGMSTVTDFRREIRIWQEFIIVNCEVYNSFLELKIKPFSIAR